MWGGIAEMNVHGGGGGGGDSSEVQAIIRQDHSREMSRRRSWYKRGRAPLILLETAAASC